MANNILILFVHPRFEQSRTNKVLIDAIPTHPNITFHDLYEAYPDFNIDIAHEQALLLAHDIIVWHHPMYWYSAPPLLKQWIDMVLDFGWAYGPGGTALEGKAVLNAFTSGGPKDAYRHDGRNRYTVKEFFRPFEQTARLCHMNYLPPFGVQGTHRCTEETLQKQADLYAELLMRLVEQNIELEAFEQVELLNDWLITPKTKEA